MKNNNRKIIAQLAKKQYYAERKRHMLITGAVAFAVMTIFCVFSFAAGKLDTDMLRVARERGVVSGTTLERATEEQYDNIKKLPYIKDVGKYVWFGSIPKARCAVVDDVTWEKIKKPAFTDIHGRYPQEKMEVMLPMRTLKALGISAPQAGMELSLPISFEGVADEKDYDFILSGYYTEYIATTEYGLPDAYFCKAFMDSVFGGEQPNMTLYLRQNDNIKEKTFESNLYRDIEMRDTDQQFVVYDTFSRQAMYSLTGGFDIAFVLSVFILVSVGLLIYNLLHISFDSNIREYGLLKTLGTTGRQLWSIVFRQMGTTVLRGGIIGVLAGVLIVLIAIPGLLDKMYLYRFGSAAGMITFHPFFLAAAVFFSGAFTFLSSALAVRHTVKLTPIEAVSYMGKTDCMINREKITMRKRKNTIPQMAWRNIMRFKRRFFVSAACLSLGLSVSLGIVMISGGADMRNEIEYDYSDICIFASISMEESLYEFCQDIVSPDEQPLLFPDELLNRIQALPEVDKCYVTRGGFGELLLEEKALDLIREKIRLSHIYRLPCTFQIVSDEYLARLKDFVKEEGLYLDVDTVMEGEGVIFLHDHAFSPAEIEKSKDTLGMTLGIYDIVTKKKVRDMRFCGYLDNKQEKLPEVSFTCLGGAYFLISEEGFKNIKAVEQNFLMNITAKPGTRLALSREAEKLVREYNEQFEPDKYGNKNMLALNITLKVDILQEMSDYIISNRIVLGALCAVLLLMGIVNYMDVTITGLTVRRREFAVMESIGLTRKQLRKILIMEGVFYSLIITVLTGCLGGGIGFVIGRVMQSRMDYFVVKYPVAEFAVCIAVLFLLCIWIVLAMYRKYEKESISHRLRNIPLQ